MGNSMNIAYKPLLIRVHPISTGIGLLLIIYFFWAKKPLSICYYYYFLPLREY